MKTFKFYYLESRFGQFRQSLTASEKRKLLTDRFQILKNSNTQFNNNLKELNINTSTDGLTLVKHLTENLVNYFHLICFLYRRLVV